jgi:hypothetical protein
MLGFGLKSKALAVLRDHYAYAPGAFQMGILNQIVGNAKSAGAKEHDVSIMFMLVQMNVLTPGEKDTRMFVLQHAQNIVKALPHAKGELADVHSLLEEILRNHQISLRQDEFLLFDDWYQSFKKNWMRWAQRDAQTG